MADHYREVELNGPDLAEFLRLLATTRPRANTHVRRFRWTGDRQDWFRTGTSLETFEAFRELFGSAAARTAMPDVLDPFPFPIGTPPKFAAVPGGALRLDGDLAALLVLGGAYRRFPGPQRTAKAKAVAAVHDLVHDHFEDFSVYSSDEAWSPWFADAGLDQTWLLVDQRHAAVTVICTTDSD
ncbi:hypothetical protein [Cellulomonas sp. URHD0024]|uniref:hypothetical protein n=1 Tax=Cellulomonas sp. URHD0024 TaxID=1302620 RepID=UPI0012DC68FD|nr:hypothetical protein [Cellulomonas sp. URHD0024]